MTRGGAFDPEANVSAADAEDGDLSGKVQITSNNVNADVPGVYQVVYSVADILGLTGTHTRTVTVRADVELVAVDAVTGDPLSGVGFSLDDENLPDTSADGKTAAAAYPDHADAVSVHKRPRAQIIRGRAERLRIHIRRNGIPGFSVAPAPER